MAQISLTQMQQALREVMATGSEAFGEGMEETGDASRQLALLQSLAMMVGKMADGIEQEDALAHWTSQLLQMLEDGAGSVDTGGTVPTQFYKAVGAMQALLGVPADVRAWSKEPDEDPLPIRVQDAREWVAQARALFPVFLAELRQQPLSPSEALSVEAIAQGVGRDLEAVERAATVECYSECIEHAKGLMHALLGRVVSGSDLFHGLVRGIQSVLEAATLGGEDKRPQERKEATGGMEDFAGSLADLPGLPGKRADVALGCAIEIEQAASWLLAEVERRPFDHQRPFGRMLKEVKRQASLVISACDDDEKTLEELQQQAD